MFNYWDPFRKKVVCEGKAKAGIIGEIPHKKIKELQENNPDRLTDR